MMSITQKTTLLINFARLILLNKPCLAALPIFCIATVNASELDARRAELLQEVRETIQDDEMARQIVEIRIKREAKKPVDEKSSPVKQAVYVGVGTRVVVGYSQKISQSLGLANELTMKRINH